jgi:hypothetical protein
MATHHLAQVNLARAHEPLDSPTMAAFVSRIDELNALAERSPGFVWRYQDGSGSASYTRPFDDKHVLFNMSVWRTIEHLRDFVYRSTHAEVFRRRHDWFGPLGRPSVALWWIPVGHTPSVEEGIAKLAHLETHGPTPAAFTSKTVFPPGGG